MSRATERSAPAWLAAGFAQRVMQWARRSARSPQADTLRQIGRAAYALSLATSAGHVCVPLRDLLSMAQANAKPGQDAADDEDVLVSAPLLASTPAGATPDWLPGTITLPALREALLRSGTVGTPQTPGAYPMILDDQDRLYLHRYFDYECRLATRLSRAAAPAASLLSDPERQQLGELLLALFADSAVRPGAPADSASAALNWQQIAVALAMTRRLTIISGGPGTGKTTTVVSLLACLLAQQPHARIALAAPTGKAAARMTDAIRSRAGHLPEALRARLPDSSQTVHRLLGVRPQGQGFVHHAKNLLPIDVLIIDEASMLDLSLATQLFEAVPEEARIVLLGDKDQLASVEAGAVYAELCQSPAFSAACLTELAALCGLESERLADLAPRRAEHSPDAAPALTDTVVWLTRNYRFASDSGIGQLAHAMRGGHSEALIAVLRDSQEPAIRWLPHTGPQSQGPLRAALTTGYTRYVQALQQTPQQIAVLFAAFNQFRVLCAVRGGPRGTRTLNAQLAAWVREQLDIDASVEWFTGRAIMVLRNDPVLNRFNGDIGIVAPDGAGRPMVWFEQADGTFEPVAPARLPAHEDAFALTIHKSQGSEFSSVAVVLPEVPSPVASRELLYTAVTRASQEVVLCAPEAVIRAAVASPTRRDSGLGDRLRLAHTHHEVR